MFLLYIPLIVLEPPIPPLKTNYLLFEYINLFIYQNVLVHNSFQEK